MDKQCQQGIILIEVIISLLLISLWLLGLGAANFAALRETKSIYYYSVAQSQLQNIRQRLHTFKQSDVAIQVAIWNEQNQQMLPQGVGMIKGTYPHYIAVIGWGGLTPESCRATKVGVMGCLRVLL